MELPNSCSTCKQRSELDFVRELFQREVLMSREYERMKRYHAEQLDSLNLYAAGLHLTNSAQSAELADSARQIVVLEMELNGLAVSLKTLQAESDQAHADALEETDHYRSQFEEAQSVMMNSAATNARLLEELEKQSLELDLAYSSARELGDMINSLLSAEDFSSEAFQGALNIADLILRSKYKDVEIQQLKDRLSPEPPEQEVTFPSCDYLDDSETTLVAETTCEEQTECSSVSASEAWRAYRAQKPLHDSTDAVPYSA